LTQYAAFIEQINPEVDGRIDPFDGGILNGKESLGFCTGLLSAFAVASAQNRKDFEKYGAVAIRLGMLVGMVVDAQGNTSPAKCLGVSWSSDKGTEELRRILDEFTEVRHPPQPSF